MTDITTASLTALRRWRPLRLTLPKLRVGHAVLSMYRIIGQAFEMAYVAPYRSSARKSPATDDANPEGRDPNW